MKRNNRTDDRNGDDSNGDAENKPLHTTKETKPRNYSDFDSEPKRNWKIRIILFFLVLLNIFLLTTILMDRYSFSRKHSTMNKETSKTKLVKGSDADVWMQCASFEEELDQLLQSTKLVFIGMPVRSAEQTMGDFARMCSESKGIEYDFERLSHQWLGFTDQYELPSIVSKHFTRKDDLPGIIQGSTDKTLIIYVHHQEKDRALGAIEFVLGYGLCGGNLDLKQSENSFTVYNTTDGTGTYCVVDESALVDIIDRQPEDVGFDQEVALPCSFHESIEENQPKMVAVNYKQVDKLQRILAKHHCPDILSRLDEETHNLNSEEETEVPVYIKLSSDTSKEVPVSEWMETKRDYLALVFALHKKNKCRGEIKAIEEKISICNDEIIQFHVDEEV